ncbi:MAG: fumarate hydratase [Desulfobacterales bacterium]|nr:fumarate hydratase [Desulfobacterales bacterium]
MKEFSILQKTLYDAMYSSMVMAVHVMPEDVRKKIEALAANEQNETAKASLELTLENCIGLNRKGDKLLCPDTGAPTYYVRLGDNVRIEGGFSAIYEIAKNAVSDATKESLLRPNMVHPITRRNPGTNLGHYAPQVDIRFDPAIEFMEVVAVPIPGGAETSGTFYRMMTPIEARPGIKNFILECVQESTYAGKTCPPNIIGIGIGGTSDLCMKIAKQAAFLRPIGSRHPEKEIAAIEEEIEQIVNSAGIGPMGMGGNSGVLDVHIEYAATHTAGLPVAFNAQCVIGRRKVARIAPDENISYYDFPQWCDR